MKDLFITSINTLMQLTSEAVANKRTLPLQVVSCKEVEAKERMLIGKGGEIDERVDIDCVRDMDGVLDKSRRVFIDGGVDEGVEIDSGRCMDGVLDKSKGVDMDGGVDLYGGRGRMPGTLIDLESDIITAAPESANTSSTMSESADVHMCAPISICESEPTFTSTAHTTASPAIPTTLEKAFDVHTHIDSAMNPASDSLIVKCASAPQKLHPDPAAIEDEQDELTLSSAEAAKQELMDSIIMLVTEYYIKYGKIPNITDIEAAFRGKLILTDDKPSPIVVNKNLQIILPYYNEMELKLSPISKTIYLFFLSHPEGIVLKNIGDYRNELEIIYTLVQPARNESLMQATLDNLLDLSSGSLMQKISKIKHFISIKMLGDDLSHHYIIKGNRGELYKVDIPREMITLPKAIQWVPLQ